MGQFMGYASYDLKTVCVHCEESGPREDMENHTCDEAKIDQLIEDLDVARMNGDYEDIGSIKRNLRRLKVEVENKPEDFEDES